MYWCAMAGTYSLHNDTPQPLQQATPCPVAAGAGALAAGMRPYLPQYMPGDGFGP